MSAHVVRFFRVETCAACHTTIGIAVRRSVADDSNLQFPCQLCSSRFQTKIGRSQQMRVKHPIEYNDSLETRADKNKGWSNRELRDLAKAKIALGASHKVNIELHKLFPQRTVQAIAAVRKKDDFRRLVVELQSEEENLDTPSVPEPVHCVGPKDVEVGRTSALREEVGGEIDRFCADHPWRDTLDRLFGLYFVEARDNGDQAFSNLMVSLSREFPRRNKPKFKHRKPLRRPNRPHPNSLRRRRPRDVRRKEKFWATQEFLSFNFSLGGRLILEGTDFTKLRRDEPEPLEAQCFYDRLIGQAEHVQPNVQVHDCTSGDVLLDLLSPLAVLEVTDALAALKPGVAAGPDSWLNVPAIKKIGPDRLRLLFNFWLASGSIPESLKGCRTLLIPKSAQASKSLDDWRPITIGSLFMRVFAKVLQARFSKFIELSARQKAFIPAEGVANNVFALRELIGSSRATRDELDVAFVDVSKAFDSIPHSAIWDALARRGSRQCS